MSRIQHYNNGNLYLSGGMQHAVDIGAGWRQTLSEQLRELNYFPIDIAQLDNAYTDKHGHLYRNLEQENLLRKINIRHHFVSTDINLIRNDTHAVIIFYDESVRKGAGTISEVHDAYMAGIPVFLVNGFENFSDIPGWMQSQTTRIFDSFLSLLAYLKELPEGILRGDVYGNRRSGNKYLCSLCGDVEEKGGAHYVSKVTPLYCKRCVSIVQQSVEELPDRYEFCVQDLERQGMV